MPFIRNITQRRTPWVTHTRIRHNNPLVKIVNGVLIDLPSPVNFSM